MTSNRATASSERGRVDEKFKVLQGEDLPQSKMTEELVRKVRYLHQKKERLKRRLDEKYSAQALADGCGVSTSTMHKVLTYETWKHVPDIDPNENHRQRKLRLLGVIK